MPSSSTVSPTLLDNVRQVAHKVVSDDRGADVEQHHHQNAIGSSNPLMRSSIDLDSQPMEIKLPVEPRRNGSTSTSQTRAVDGSSLMTSPSFNQPQFKLPQTLFENNTNEDEDDYLTNQPPGSCMGINDDATLA